MKKILIFALLLVFAVSLTACAKGEPTEGLKYKTQDGKLYVAGIGEATKKKDIVIPAANDGKSVVGIAQGAFVDCVKIRTLTIPASVKDIDPSAFIGCVNLETIIVNGSNSTYTSIDGNVYTKDRKTLVLYAPGNSASNFTIPDTVTTIATGAFSACVNLATLNIPDSVTTIQNGAFEGCKSIETVNFGKGLIAIGDYAFAGCTSITALEIPDSVSIIGSNAFFNCEALGSLTLGTDITSIGEAAFAHCVSLESIVISSTSINAFNAGNQVFMNAGNAKYGIDVTFSANVENVPAYLFSTSEETAPNIKSVTFEDASACKTIGVSAFRYCVGIQKLTVSSKQDFKNIQFMDTYSDPRNINQNIVYKEAKKQTTTTD